MKVALLLAAVSVLAAEPKVPSGAKLFVTAMDKNLDSFLVAEIQKQKLPVHIVLSQEDAQYVLTVRRSPRAHGIQRLRFL